MSDQDSKPDPAAETSSLGWFSPYPYEPAEHTPPTGLQPPTDAGLGPATQRRITVAVCWALARRAALDGRELYEDSFALSEEYREWLLSLEEHPEVLADNVLMVPTDLHRRQKRETDGLLEI